jgi:hypothetical protein
MKEKEPPKTDPHLNAPSESNREKHINFREVEEDSPGNFAVDKSISERQKQWRKEIEEGEEQKSSADTLQNNSAVPLDDDDTVGIP